MVCAPVCLHSKCPNKVLKQTLQGQRLASPDNRAVESIGSSKHFYMFMWFLGRRGLFSLLDLLCPTAFPLTADEHKELLL